MKLMMIPALTALLFTLSAVGSVFADSAPTNSPGTDGPKFGMGFQFGAMAFNGTNYNSIRLQPDFGIGKFGIGLDINFEFDANGNFRFTEWNTWQAIVSKVLYVRWGVKGEPFYIKVGSISDFNLGNGFIVKRYSNMLNYPSIKKLGVALDVDFGVFGFESMVENIFLFDILGLRAYVRPLTGTDMPLLNKLEIGATIVADLGTQNPVPPADTPYHFTYAASNSTAVVYGVDVGLPIVDIPLIFSMRAYGEFAQILGKGTGEAAGLAGRIVTFIPYTLEARLLQPKFAPSYFDTYYDAARSTKYNSLDSITNSYAGWLFSSGLSLLEDKLIWSLQIEGAFGPAALPSLTMNLLLSKDVFKLFGGQFTWIRQNIGTFWDIFAFQNASSILMFTFDYYLSANVALSLNYKRTFSVDQNGAVQPFDSTTISTKLAF